MSLSLNEGLKSLVWQYDPYAFPLFVSAAVTGGLAAFMWSRRRTPSATAFMLLLLAATEWSLAAAGKSLAADLYSNILWDKAAYLGLVSTPVMWIIFVLQYTDRGAWLRRRNLLLLWVVPILTVLLAWTNEAHHLIYIAYEMVPYGAVVMSTVTYGVWFYFLVAYSYLLVFLGIALLLEQGLSSHGLLRRQSVMLVVAALLPLVGDAVNVIGYHYPADLAPLAFAFTGLLGFWVVFRYQLLKIIPIAHEAVIRNMADGVIVIDSKGSVVDVNQAGERMVGCRAADAVGRSAAELFKSCGVDAGFLASPHSEIALASGGVEHYFDVNVSDLQDTRGGSIGRMAVLRDVTELSESEEKYRVIVENSSDMICIAQDGVLKYVNKRLCERLGWTFEEMTSPSFNFLEKIVAPSYRGLIAENIARRLGGESLPPYEINAMTRNGTEFPIIIRAERITYRGAPADAVTVLDITDRKRAEEVLRRRAEELSALQASVLGITEASYDLPSLLEAIVKRAVSLLDATSGGLDLCDPEKREVRCVVSYNTPQDFRGVVLKYGEGSSGRVAETGKPLIIDDYRKWEGAANISGATAIGAEISAPMTWRGQVIGVIQVTEDSQVRHFTQSDLELLTLFANHAAVAVVNARLYGQVEQHAAQLEGMVEERTRKLAESQARYRRLFESSPVSLWEEDFSDVKKYFDELRGGGVKDLREYLVEHPEDVARCASMVKVVDVNEATLELYGAKTVGELLGELDRVLTHESEAEFRFREELVALGEGRTRFESEFDNHTLTGDVRHVSLILSVVPGYESTLEKVLVSIIDLTERKWMEMRLQQTERLAAIGQTAAMVGHDLRNPLQAISSATYVLEKNLTPAASEQTQEMLEAIENSVRYSDRIVDDLMEYSQDLLLELSVATPKSLLSDAMSQVKIPKNITISDSTSEDLKIRVDAAKIKRVFVNLVENAVDAMPKGGELKIRSNLSNGCLEVKFTDTGPGVDGNVLRQLWKPLVTTKPKGIGLGLAICKRIAEAHGGSISVDSKAGEGTTFTLTIPIAPRQAGDKGT